MKSGQSYVVSIASFVVVLAVAAFIKELEGIQMCAYMHIVLLMKGYVVTLTKQHSSKR